MAEDQDERKAESILGMADALAGKLEIKPMERPTEIESRPHRPQRKDLWPPEIWRQMHRIWRGEEP